MTHTNNLPTQPIHSASLFKPMLFGAAFALLVITIFLLGVNNADPAWGKLWMVRPLIIVPLAGATGGLCYYFINHALNRGGWTNALAIILSLLVYIIGLWLGTVLGLAGTLWN